MVASEAGVLRIGELSRRVGVSGHVLRAWESRYGLLRPTRSGGGYRLYSADDEHRVRRMKALMADGLSAAEAAKTVRDESAPTPSSVLPGEPGPPELAGRRTVADDGAALRRALESFDEPAAQAVLDSLLTQLSLASVLRDVVMPYLQDLGQRWELGTASVAQEHFASNVLRGRLAGLARGWGGGSGPLAVLACPPGELHDLPLMIFGIALNRLGWRVTYLGSSTPLADLLDTVDSATPTLVVLAATVPERFEAIAPELAELARRSPLALAGTGASQALADAAGARLLAGDPVSEAESLAATG
jgi:DNA-binding transcriptional MerR regulator